MPEPLLYLKAIGAAAVVSAMFVLAMAGLRRPAGAGRLNAACVFAIGFGLAIGYYVLALQVAWPPKSALDRFLTIVLPAALVVELIGGFQRVPRWVVWLLRLALAAAIPRILLHGSVYLGDYSNAWTLWQATMVLAISGGLLASVWSLLAWLPQRSPGVAIPISLCLATQCAGLTVMMAGYIKGGAAAFPLTMVLLATTIASRLMMKGSDLQNNVGSPTKVNAMANFAAPAVIGVGVVGLFSLLFTGRFYGRLSTGPALVMLLAPLLCWLTELPFLRHRNPWLVGTLRLTLVAIPLLVVLVLAKRDFDRDMAPLLSLVQEFTF